MKILIVGATGSIGSTILQYCLRRPEITQVVAITRRPIPSPSPSSSEHDAAKLSHVLIPDFGALDAVPDSTWVQLADADALIWAMGTYDLNEDVNLNYPLAFQERIATRLRRDGKTARFRFILLGGAFTETNQSRRLFLLWDQRRMKGLLQAKTLKFAEDRSEMWEAVVIRPGGILLGGEKLQNRVAKTVFGDTLVVRGEEVGACVADLVVIGSEEAVVENLEIVERGRRALIDG
ncbi:hypothetical protein BDW02DRAFT_352065 [Decorospora gaudefroyi]|uniref:Uncharacterized protein n=1 Tax=Decorospora gaudefroyi TaxID=184978 RepID=A0A6A5KI57_9PLEO|nr:hypothetical protein BDW02DRAFT_352065 [Decorospora gaudefroyi]